MNLNNLIFLIFLFSCAPQPIKPDIQSDNMSPQGDEYIDISVTGDPIPSDDYMPSNENEGDEYNPGDDYILQGDEYSNGDPNLSLCMEELPDNNITEWISDIIFFNEYSYYVPSENKKCFRLGDIIFIYFVLEVNEFDLMQSFITFPNGYVYTLPFVPNTNFVTDTWYSFYSLSLMDDPGNIGIWEFRLKICIDNDCQEAYDYLEVVE